MTVFKVIGKLVEHGIHESIIIATGEAWHTLSAIIL